MTHRDAEAEQGWPGGKAEPEPAFDPGEDAGVTTGEPLGAVEPEGDGAPTGEPLGPNPVAAGAEEPEGEPAALEQYDDAHPELRAPGDEDPERGPDEEATD